MADYKTEAMNRLEFEALMRDLINIGAIEELPMKDAVGYRATERGITIAELLTYMIVGIPEGGVEVRVD